MIIEFIQYKTLENLSSLSKIYKILKIAKENKIVMIEGRLSKQEEGELIKITMEEITEDFKGIELAVIEPTISKEDFLSKLKMKVVNYLAKERLGFTIVGPANIVKEIKKNPNKIELLTYEMTKTKVKKSSKKLQKKK